MKRWIVLSLVLIGCSPKVISYLNEKAPFHTFETYRIVSAKAQSQNITADNTFIFDQIRTSIQSQMDSRSYKLSSVTPDLTLRYEVTSSTRMENNNMNDPRLMNPLLPINNRTIFESILLLELLDSKNKLVWQGSYDLKQLRKEKQAAKAVEKAVALIFETYPRQALSKEVYYAEEESGSEKKN